MSDEPTNPGAVPVMYPHQADTTGVTRLAGYAPMTPPPMQSTGKKISIKDIDVPLLLTMSFIACIAGGVASVTAVWWKTTSHISDTHIHANIDKAVEGRGIAYKAEIEGTEQRLDKAIREQTKATRKLLTTMTIHCERDRGQGMSCSVTLPEP